MSIIMEHPEYDEDIRTDSSMDDAEVNPKTLNSLILPDPTNDEDEILVVMYFRDRFLDHMGEVLGVECRMSAFNVITEYKSHARDLFESFDSMEVQRIMRKSMDKYMNFSYLIQSKVIESYFVCHHQYKRDMLRLIWRESSLMKLLFGFFFSSE